MGARLLLRGAGALSRCALLLLYPFRGPKMYPIHGPQSAHIDNIIKTKIDDMRVSKSHGP